MCEQEKKDKRTNDDELIPLKDKLLPRINLFLQLLLR